MIERKRIESIATFGMSATREEIAELCRVYLKVLDAQVVEVSVDDHGQPFIEDMWPMMGKRVRLVEVGE